MCYRYHPFTLPGDPRNHNQTSIPIRMPPLELRNETVWIGTLPTDDRDILACDDGPLMAAPDVLVVGGGIIGLAVAYFLAVPGKRVQLVTDGALGAGATSASAGGVWPSDQGPQYPPVFSTLALRSRDLWGRLSLKPGFDFDWRVNGFLTVNPERFRHDRLAFASQAQELGYTTHAIDAEQVAQLEPALAAAPLGGVHCPSDAHLNPLRAAASFVRAARRLGARFGLHTRCLEVIRESGRVSLVRTTAGDCRPKALVHCGGAASLLSGAVVRPLSGQMIATDPLPPLLRGVVGGRYLTLQLKTGEVLTGGTVAENGCQTPEPGLSAEMARAAAELIPGLRETSFTRAWCGVRSATQDGLPIIDRAADCDNEWHAVGHHRNGVLLAPATGELLARWLCAGERPEELAPYGLSRFMH